MVGGLLRICSVMYGTVRETRASWRSRRRCGSQRRRTLLERILVTTERGWLSRQTWASPSCSSRRRCVWWACVAPSSLLSEGRRPKHNMSAGHALMRHDAMADGPAGSIRGRRCPRPSLHCPLLRPRVDGTSHCQHAADKVTERDRKTACLRVKKLVAIWRISEGKNIG